MEEDLAKLILYSAASVRGIFLCNREQFKQLNRALESGGVRPIIDKVSQASVGRNLRHSSWLVRCSSSKT